MRATRIAYRIGVAVAGGIVIVLGLILVPLPGPGWPVVFAGFAVLGTEFAWARRVVDGVRIRVAGGVRWSRRAAWPIRAAIGATMVLCTVAPVVLLTPVA